MSLIRCLLVQELQNLWNVLRVTHNENTLRYQWQKMLFPDRKWPSSDPTRDEMTRNPESKYKKLLSIDRLIFKITVNNSHCLSFIWLQCKTIIDFTPPPFPSKTKIHRTLIHQVVVIKNILIRDFHKFWSVHFSELPDYRQCTGLVFFVFTSMSSLFALHENTFWHSRRSGWAYIFP